MYRFGFNRYENDIESKGIGASTENIIDSSSENSD
jgi:hypothetical protein